MSVSEVTSSGDPEEIEDALQRAGIEYKLTIAGALKVRLTRTELANLTLLSSRESRARAAYVKFAPHRVFVSFVMPAVRSFVWAGVRVEQGDVVFHSQGEQSHQRTMGACHWAFISQTPEHLAACSRALTGRELVPPRTGRVLRLSRSLGGSLCQLHADACRLAETKTELVQRSEVVHALEQNLIHALINCLVAGEYCRPVLARQRGLEIMRQFEQLLSTTPSRLPEAPELCEALGVSELTLRRYCLEFLGMGPTRYLHFRRLMMVRATIRGADPTLDDVPEIAKRHGFLQYKRFLAEYQFVFREAPSIPNAK